MFDLEIKQSITIFIAFRIKIEPTGIQTGLNVIDIVKITKPILHKSKNVKH